MALSEQNGRLFFLGNGATLHFLTWIGLKMENTLFHLVIVSLTALSNDYDYSLAMVEFLNI